MSSYNRYMQNHIGTILSGLIVAFIIGTLAMIYNADKSNEVFKAQLNFIAARVTVIETDLKKIESTMLLQTGDRWTKTDHDKYDKNIEVQFREIYTRLRKLENKVFN